MARELETIRQHTKEWLVKRCVETDTKWTDLGIEFGQEFSAEQLLSSNRPVYLITVIFGNSLDESFYTICDVELAKTVTRWVAEDCAIEADSAGDNPHEDWSVILEEYHANLNHQTVLRINN